MFPRLQRRKWWVKARWSQPEANGGRVGSFIQLKADPLIDRCDSPDGGEGGAGDERLPFDF